MRNIYDNSEFFAAYAEMGRSKDGLKAAGEWHQLQPLFPKLQGKKVLDLGCGYGWHCKYAAQMGATEILGIDSSQKMIAKAELITLMTKSSIKFAVLKNTFILKILMT